MSRVVEQKSTNHLGSGHETHRYMQVPEVTNAVFSGCWEEGDEEKVDVWGGCRWRGCLTDLPFYHSFIRWMPHGLSVCDGK